MADPGGLAVADVCDGVAELHEAPSTRAGLHWVTATREEHPDA